MEKRAVLGSSGFFAALVSLVLVSGCAASDDDLGASASGPKIDTCNAAGDGFRCDGQSAVACSDGSLRLDCKASGMTCTAGIGCVKCQPGSGTCANGEATVCRPDGSGYETYACDTEQGMTCTANGCVGACSWGALGSSYVGCDYYPTVTINNGVWGGFEFAVALSNVGKESANVIVTRGSDTIQTLTVEPGNLEVVRLPWVPELKGPDPNFMGQPQSPGGSRLVKGGAYRVRSDQPVAAYQFNPLDYRLDPPPKDCPRPTDSNGCFSFSNDASLLLPAHMLRGTYDVLTWPTLGCKTGFFTVTAIADGTEVKLEPRGDIAPGGGFDSSGQGYAKLDRGDVLQMLGVTSGGPFCFDIEGSDVSGTMVEATRPVQVIAGHGCANIPAPETQACDHVEEVMFPLETLGREYLIVVPATPSGPSSDAQQTIRIMAHQESTEVVFDPPVSDSVVLGPKDAPLELRYVRENLHIKATKPILVAQFMQGTDANGDQSVSGDPAQSLGIPTGQYRNQYTFLAPDNYATSWVDVTAKLGSSVEVDGQVVASFSPIGQSGWGMAHVELGAGSVHSASAKEAFGITVYGYGDWTSYMYPGGLNLGTINPTVK